ncbi:MAG: cytochrome P450 [Paracoccaceae bacterium]|nr:cytochrome P450 [Paracoccaceae bacterium]
MDATKINLTDPAFWQGPVNFDAFAALRRDLPVSWHDFVEGPEHGMKGFWSLTRYEDIVAVSQNAGLFRNQPTTYIGDQSEEEAQAEGWFLNMDGPRHFMLRSVVQKILSPKGVEKYRANAEGHATALVMAAKEKGEVDFARDVAQPYPVAVICDFLGAPPSDRKHMHTLTQHALAGDAPELGGPASVSAAFKELNDYGTALARERRRAPKDDFLSYLHTVEVEGRKFTDEEIGIQFQLLVTAGMETTGTVGSHLMRLFMENPDQMALWATDPVGMAPAAVEEMVRLVTPVMHMRRTAAEDTEIAGQKIAAGDKVVLWFISGNRDETKFDAPDAFRVQRNPNPHIGFGGGGRHTCLGAHLARMELPILARLTLEHLGMPEPAGEPVYVASRFANGLLSLPVRFNQGGRA